MKRLVVLIFSSLLVALSAGRVLRLPSSYENGVKWAFDANVPGDISARSHHVGELPVAPVVYQKEPLVRTVYRKVSAGAGVYKEAPVAPAPWSVHRSKSVVSAPSVYKQQQPAAPVTHRTRPGQASAVHRTSEPIKLTVLHHQDQSPHHHHHHYHDVVPAGPRVDSWQKAAHHVRNYQYTPHHVVVRDHAVRAVAHE